MSSAPAAALCALLAAGPARAEVKLAVSGAAEVLDGALEVRVDLRNDGDSPAPTLMLEGEFLGARTTGRLETGIPAGEARSVHLSLPLDSPRPGVHPVLLLIEYPLAGDQVASQRAYLLVALAGGAAPAVKASAPELALEFSGVLPVRLESADAAPHRVRLYVATPKGLGAEPPGEVAVPAHGTVFSPVRLFRTGAPRGTAQGVLVVAEASDGGVERTTVIPAVVRVLPDSARLPHLRRPLLALAVLLLLAAAVAEARRWRRRP